MNHLIVTEYFRLTNSLINELCFKDVPIIKMDLNVNTLSEVIEEAKYNSLFDEYKNIVVYNANLFSASKYDEKEVDSLIDYINNPNPCTCLIFISNEKIDSRKKITKLFKDNNSIHDCFKISYYDLVDFTNKYIKSNKWKINNDVINYVIKASNNNYDIICSELDKLMLCFKDNPSLEDAKKIISSAISDNVFKFVDAFVEKDSKKSLKYLDELKIYKTDPSIIIMSLYRTFRQMLFYKIAASNSININTALKHENLQDWQIKKLSENCKKYSLEDLSNIIHLLAEYDFRYKSGVVDKDTAINMLILEIIN